MHKRFLFFSILTFLSIEPTTYAQSCAKPTLVDGETVNELLVSNYQSNRHCFGPTITSYAAQLSSPEFLDHRNLCIKFSGYKYTYNQGLTCKARLVGASTSNFSVGVGISIPDMGFVYCYCMRQVWETFNTELSELALVITRLSTNVPCNYTASFTIIDTNVRETQWSSLKLDHLDETGPARFYPTALATYNSPQYEVPAGAFFFYRLYTEPGPSGYTLAVYGTGPTAQFQNTLYLKNGTTCKFTSTVASVPITFPLDESIRMLNLSNYRNLSTTLNQSWIVRPDAFGIKRNSEIYGFGYADTWIHFTFCLSLDNCNLAPLPTISPSTLSSSAVPYTYAIISDASRLLTNECPLEYWLFGVFSVVLLFFF